MPAKPMTRTELLAIIRDWNNAAMALLETKGEDYSGADVHANFKRMHAICALYDIRPGERQEDVYLFLLFLKMDRLIHNLHKPGEPNHESVNDTVLDHTNYMNLLATHLTVMEKNE